MPNGSPFQANAPSTPASPMSPGAGQVPARRLPPEMEELQKQVASVVLDIAARVKLLEQRVENLRGHIELLDTSMIDKHKSVISELRDAEDGMRGLRADIDAVKDLSERMTKRSEAFALRDDVKVLQRYVELWQPLQFVTRPELKTVVQSILKDHGIKLKE